MMYLSLMSFRFLALTKDCGHFILYVEEEPDIQLIAQIALEDIGGVTLKLCNSGFEAIQEAEKFKPDLLLLDVMMPGLDGPATLEHQKP